MWIRLRHRSATELPSRLAAAGPRYAAAFATVRDPRRRPALPLLRKSSNPTVVTVSSSMGSFWAVTNPERPESAMPLALYAASKSAAAMLTVQYAKLHPGIKFNALEPGTTATDMTAAFGIGRPVEESARIVVRLATLGADGPTGTFQDENGDLPF
ncbi:SDR family NAD(P)-dependent oxidoreductase [Actinoplanes auranticolor]|uniref:SDR family NAD(P)-dependent oxidoreductase n=1 Tax=Actinoplanes auranticolor TaxID=47988 RepID=UPI0034DB4CFB